MPTTLETKTNSRDLAELARLRKLNLTPPRRGEPVRLGMPCTRHLYEANVLSGSSGTGWRADADRRVLTHWAITSVDGAVLHFKSGQLDESRHPPSDETFKVRFIRGVREGEVAVIPLVEYVVLRNNGFTDPGRPLIEPVPEDEPLCPPARAVNMPSSFRKSREITARSLGKHPEEVTFDECVAFFRSKLK
jgi:hypothetical protein